MFNGFQVIKNLNVKKKPKKTKKREAFPDQMIITSLPLNHLRLDFIMQIRPKANY